MEELQLEELEELVQEFQGKVFESESAPGDALWSEVRCDGRDVPNVRGGD